MQWDAWSRRRRVLSVLAGALLLSAGLFASYCIAVNVLIRTRLLRALINDGPDKVWIEYSSAYSLWPGRLRVSNLQIRDRARVSEWIITLDEGRASVSLLDLLRGRFHPTRIRGSGLALRVRGRLTPEEATPRRLSFLPPISGFPAPPLLEPGETNLSVGLSRHGRIGHHGLNPLGRKIHRSLPVPPVERQLGRQGAGPAVQPERRPDTQHLVEEVDALDPPLRPSHTGHGAQDDAGGRPAQLVGVDDGIPARAHGGRERLLVQSQGATPHLE